jgi:hypothetical protein
VRVLRLDHSDDIKKRPKKPQDYKNSGTRNTEAGGISILCTQTDRSSEESQQTRHETSKHDQLLNQASTPSAQLSLTLSPSHVQVRSQTQSSSSPSASTPSRLTIAWAYCWKQVSSPPVAAWVRVKPGSSILAKRARVWLTSQVRILDRRNLQDRRVRAIGGVWTLRD